jgi:hypothetical protein
LTNCVEITDFSTNKINTTIEIDGKKQEISSLSSKSQLIKLLLKYIDNMGDIEKKQRERIQVLLNEMVNEICDNNKLLNKKEVEFESIEISNLLPFGKYVYLDFEKVKGLTGIFENNSAGKSSLLDTICIALYGKTPRSSLQYGLVRSGQKNAYCILKMKVNRIRYIITRKYVWNSPTTKQVSCTGLEIKKGTSINNTNYKVYTDKKEVQNIIDNEIMEYEELYLTTIVSQRKEINFLDSKNKKQTIFKYSGLSVFNDINQECLENVKKMGSECTNIYKLDIFDKYRKKAKSTKDENAKQELIDIKTLIDDKLNINNKELNLVNEQYNQIEESFNKLNNDYIIICEKLSQNEIEEIEELEEYDIDEIKNEIKSLKKEIKDISIEKLEKTSNNINKNIIQINKKLQKYKNIENEKKDFEKEKKNNINKFNDKINTLNRKLKETEDY